MAKRRTKRQQPKATPPLLRRLTRGPALLAIVTVAAAGAFIALLAISLATTGDGKLDRIEGIPVEGRTRGSATAPVTVIEFSDYQCPFCKRFAETVELEIEREYIATDQVRLEFRNMAFIGPESVWAAEAAQCANDQGKFWEYHDKLFEKQRGENSGAFSRERLKRFAGDLALDQETFDACLDSGRHEQLVVEETEAGRYAGVDSTPWIFVNGETVRGTKLFEELSRVIEEKLEEAATSP